jgi:2-polyprenyl-6-methoxyphenol hydroxylase-like FAD-dependent oxidoreductase
MNTSYDVVVIGARCAGAPTAMLLARKGYRVLVVDRATFPSDTISTHILHPLAGASLARWELLDPLLATGCPEIHSYDFDFGSFTISGRPGTEDAPLAYCPRRTILDQLLVDAAAAAGAEVREGFVVDEILVDDGRVTGIRGHSSSGRPFTEHARVVVGADGRHSRLAAAVQPEQYDEKPPLLCGYYSYWSDLPMEGRFEMYSRPGRAFAAAPTHGGLTLVIAGWPAADFDENRSHIERSVLETIGLAPAFAERIRRARRQAPFVGAMVPNFFRKPYGPGWALVGDAGYNRDFITAQGILDAFRDAERCAEALDQALTGARAFDEAMGAYQRDRDQRVKAMYQFTCQLATLEPPPPELQRLLAAIHGNQAAMDAFARMNAGTISPAAFFAPESVGAMLAGTRV